jgi:hypothetical protein
MRGINGPYYTRSLRVNGRVVREYVGGGPVGRLTSQIDDVERLEKCAATRRLREERTRLREPETLADDLARLADLVARATLLAAGYRRHDRGEWRRRREQA